MRTCSAANEKLVQLESGRAQALATTTELKKKLESEIANQEDIFEYLRGEIHNKNNLINELQDKNMALLEDQERLTQEHERSQQELADRSMEEKAVLQQEVTSVRAELKKVETFIRKEAELEEELKNKKRLLAEGRQEHTTSISDLERKHVQEKDRLKKEMLLKLRETKANLLKMTDNQLDTTTKRTIAENEQMSSELAWQSKETEKLIRKNDKLMSENASLKRELSLHRQTEEGFARKVNVYQKTIKTLLVKLNDLDAKQQAELQRMHLDDDEKEREKAEGLRERDHLEDSLLQSSAQLRAAHESTARISRELQAVRSKYGNVLALQDEAVKFTLQCLLDMRVQSPLSAQDYENKPGFGDGNHLEPVQPMTLQMLNVNEREEVMRYILDELRAYQEQVKELELHAAWKQHGVASAFRGETGFPPIPRGVSSAVWATPGPPFPEDGGTMSSCSESHDRQGGVMLGELRNLNERVFGRREAQQ